MLIPHSDVFFSEYGILLPTFPRTEDIWDCFFPVQSPQQCRTQAEHPWESTENCPYIDFSQ